MHFVFLDTETGGLDPKEYDLLEYCFVLTDLELNVKDKISLKVAPTIALPVIHPAAAKVNGITAENHSGVPYGVGKVRLLDKLDFWRDPKNKHSIIPVGWNLAFDLSFIYEFIMPSEEFNSYVSYRTLDVMQINNFLALTKPETGCKFGGLQQLCKTYGLKHENAHSSEGDVLATIEMFKYLKGKI